MRSDNGFDTAAARFQNDLSIDDNWRKLSYAYALDVIDDYRDAQDAVNEHVGRLSQPRCDWDCDGCHAHQENCLDTCDEYCPGDHDE